MRDITHHFQMIEVFHLWDTSNDQMLIALFPDLINCINHVLHHVPINPQIKA